ncbi:hypothetical protein [Rhodopseudomonas sp.]|uniref:hypothetical protein n=1 Tax=Rhodopseudomonas sp. TaxID=1078 RepID=UPI0039E3EED0
MKGLIVREPWLGMILDGRKTWELRTQPTALRGEIALIRKGSCQIVGVAELVDSLPRLDAQGLAEAAQFHGVPPEEQAGVVANGWLFPWLLINARPLSSPVPYDHPGGAVTWVNLDPDVTSSVARAGKGRRPERTARPAEQSARPLALPSARAATGPQAEEIEPTSEPGARISPALEAEIVATADRLGVKVKPLGSNTTKMRVFTVTSRAGGQFMLLNRMARSSSHVQIFVAPSLDSRIAAEIASTAGASRFINARTGDHRMSHSAFRVFKEPQPTGEPFGHGWLLDQHRAGELFSRMVEIIRG